MIVLNPFRPGSWTRAQIESVSKGWWILLITGIISVVAGGIIVGVDWTVSDLAVFIGALLIFQGIFTLFSVPVDGSLRTWSIVYGLIELGVGIAVWVWPGPTLLVVAFFIGWMLLFRGIMAIAGSISGRNFIPYWGWILVLGIVEVAVSFYLLSRPGLTLVAAVLAIGLLAMFYGVMEIILSFEVKNLPKRFDELGEEINNGSTATRRFEPAAH